MISPKDALEILKPIEDNERNLQLLVDQLQNPIGVIPFVGAGLSIPAGFPGWTSFLLGLACKRNKEARVQELLDAGHYEEVAEELMEALGLRLFDDEFSDTFGDHRLPDRVTGAAAVLPRMFAGPVITTNFERVLENAFKPHFPFQRVVWGARTQQAVAAFHQHSHFLLKIHGDVDYPSDRVLTKSEYDQHYGSSDPDAINLDHPLPRLLQLMLESRPVLFLGCSLNKDRTITILKKLAKEGVAHYAVVEKPASDDEFNEKARHISYHGIRPIWYSAGRHDLIEPLLVYLSDQIPPYLRPKRILRSTNRPLLGPNDPLLSHRTGFLGHEDEARRVVAFLASADGMGIVTPAPGILNVEGAPGIGKTEVCKEALRRHIESDPGQRVYYVELAEARDLAGLLARLAEAFEVNQAGGREAVLQAMGAAPCLVYLDNLEDVIADRDALSLICQFPQIPGVRVLASCRQICAGIATNIPIERLGIEAAVGLFRQEWRRGGAAEIADSDELREFIRQDLDCHALSIVLVAAQGYQHGSLAELRKDWKQDAMEVASIPGLADRLSLEASFSRSAKAALRESSGALRAWGTIALFPDGMSTSAWNFIFANDLKTANAARAALVRLNIVKPDEQGTLRMLAPLRQFILRRAARGEALDTQSLAGFAFPYFQHLAQEARDHHFDERHTETLDGLLAEFLNLHSFMLFACDLGGPWPAKLSELSFNLLYFYQWRILLGEEILRRLLPIQQKGGLRVHSARTLAYLGDLELPLGKLDEAAEHFRQAMELHRQERDNLGLANAIRSLGDVERYLGKL
ncbi:MAG TPA: SIR2 family protein, partial [Planctomycetota bacterium]|nr:SIR2 family protein [Planctomycetota bacterium]